MENVVLKPCAHCGAEPKIMKLNNGISTQVRCTNCGIRTLFGNEELAFRTWNRRQEEVDLEHVGYDDAQIGRDK